MSVAALSPAVNVAVRAISSEMEVSKRENMDAKHITAGVAQLAKSRDYAQNRFKCLVLRLRTIHFAVFRTE